MADTPKLLLPQIAANQDQKHITHNEALLILDAIVQVSVKDRGLTAPPGSPADGDRYIPASASTGAWSGWDLNIAAFQNGAWVKYVPREGWRVWIEDEAILMVYTSAAWVEFGAAALVSAMSTGVFSLLGINGATADTTNRFSINTPGILLNRAVDDILLNMNKQATADDAGLLR